MNFEQLKELIDHIDRSSLYEFEMENDDISLKLSKRKTYGAAGVVQTSEPVESNNHVEPAKKYSPLSDEKTSEDSASLDTAPDEDLHELKAPIVGTGYLSSSPDAPPFVSEGDAVSKGQTICIIEAMKVMNEIKSDVDGTVSQFMIEDGQPVEFNQSLIKIKPN